MLRQFDAQFGGFWSPQPRKLTKNETSVEVGVTGVQAERFLTQPAAGGGVVPAGIVFQQLSGRVVLLALVVGGLVDRVSNDNAKLLLKGLTPDF